MTSPDLGPTVVVTGVGQADAAPDAVRIDLGVQASAPTPAQAVREAAVQLERLLGVLATAGVVGADRQTTGMTSSPSWDHATGVESGHETTYSLRVVVDDLAAAGVLVEQAAQACGPALRLHGFELLVRDPGPHLRVARERAVHACRAQAEQLAAAADRALGGIVLLREGESEPVSGRYMKMARRPAGIAVEPGEQGMTVVVTATYALVG